MAGLVNKYLPGHKERLAQRLWLHTIAQTLVASAQAAGDDLTRANVAEAGN
jgi:hypothetical protein